MVKKQFQKDKLENSDWVWRDRSLSDAHLLVMCLPFRNARMSKMLLAASDAMTYFISASSTKRSINTVLSSHQQRMNSAIRERRKQKPRIPFPHSMKTKMTLNKCISSKRTNSIYFTVTDIFGRYCISIFFFFLRRKQTCVWMVKMQHINCPTLDLSMPHR